MHIAIVNGPNLNLLGRREPEWYGTQTFESFLEELHTQFSGVTISYFQSNEEGRLISKIQELGDDETDGIILNAGGYAHTSIALADAVRSIEKPVIEVHISNIFSREDYRHHSFLTPVCKGLITGLGLSGYTLAMRYLLAAKSKK